MYANNPSITAQKVFAGMIFYFSGNIFGNTINPYVIRVIGYKNMMFLSGIVCLYQGYILVDQFTLFQVFLGRFLLGYYRAIVWDSNNLFLSEKHASSGGVLYAKYLHTFRYFISSVFIFLSQIYINPTSQNAQATAQDERVFSDEINNNFVDYIYLQTLIFFFCLVIPPVFMRVPFRLESQIFPWLKSFFKKNNFQHSMTRQEVSILMRTSQASIHINQDISRSFHGSLLEDNKFEFEEENENPTHLFYYMFVFLIFDNIMCTYLGDNYKYVCLLMNFDDAEISFFFFLSPFIVCACNIIASYCFQNYGLKKSFFIMTFVNTLDLVLVFISMTYKPIFLWTIFFTRFYGNFSMILNDLVAFSVFRPTTGIMFVKLFTFGYFIAACLAIFINSFIVDPENIYPIFYLFTALNLLNYVIGAKVFTKYKFEKQLI